MTGAENDITIAVKKLHSITFNPLIEGMNSSEYTSLKTILKLREDSKFKEVHVSDISKKLGISAPSVTKLLNCLENKGFIKREIDKENRRNTLVYVTKKGLEITQHNDDVLAKFISNVYDRVGRENIVQFLQLSQLIHNAFDEEIEKFSLLNE